ncbi:von Willebrand factor C and EGF domain-containing protein isoform X3 [Mus caroli]|uniref:von Willebrand factor C and EGF domain-containing protein n=1 Tax=Mus caroli TaxID=10089 RepID=A0A6P7QJB8_MUSCR|nr:von Willebrand factor C and EGF domain-containing protein isoform X3 [Mus caroli]
MWARLLLHVAYILIPLLGSSARGYTGRKAPGHYSAERRRLGPHVCLSGFGSGCCPGWAPSMGSGHCTLQAHGSCGEYGCDLTCNHGGCQEVARVCPVGFLMTETAVGIRCADIDECLSSSCEGHCVNTEGGFVCECGPGMQLSADRHSCQDTDECLGTPCQQRCKNSIGSYKCSCRAGFHLHGNRHSCIDVNECRRPQERKVCHHTCHNTVGSFLCTCRPGFRLRSDRVSCEAFPKAVLAPSAILQPRQHPAKMSLLLPEAGRPALSPGHSPPPGAPGYPTGVRTISQPSTTQILPTFFPTQLISTPVPSSSPPGTLGPPSLLQGAVGTPSSPRGPESPKLGAGPSSCWHLGATYESGSRWNQPGCSQCLCQDGEVTCGGVRCDATCSHPVPPRDGGCCPSCTGCFHSGAIRAEGDVFSPPEENCTVCVCLAGNVSCISPECPPGPCKASPQSDCCTCVPGRCYFHGRWYTDGAVFSGGGDDCTTCVCQNGEVECSFTPCPELECPREEWLLGPGQCCFTCREPAPTTGCSLDDNGVEFPIGQIWSPGDPCELCVCQADGSVSCKRTDCVDSCPHPIRIPGQCCPDCSAGCTYTGRIFYNNETFPSVLDPCLSCICLLGSVACSPVDCPITCTYPFHPDGECCPVCHDCNFEGRKVANGQVFTLDDEPCTRCICQLGEVSCETVPCRPICTDPSCPDSVFPLEEKQQPSPHGELAKAARNARGDTEVPVNCSSCPGPPSASPARPMVHLLQWLLRTNLSNVQSASPSPPIAQTSASLLLEPEAVSLGKPRASQPPEPSAGSPVSPRLSTLPPAIPGTPLSPVTPESSSSTFGTRTAFQWLLSATPLTEAETPSMTDADLSETLTTSLSSQRLSAALLDTPNPVPQQSTTDTSKKENSTI